MKILITGPESSGKSTLARSLAWALDGVYVREVARAYLNELNRPYTADDLPRILARQLAAEDQGVAQGASFTVCDTGPEVIRVWSEVKYGWCAPVVMQAFTERSYALTLLCKPDLPWEADPLREYPDAGHRMEHFHRYRALLPDAHIIAGDDRLAAALRAVNTVRPGTITT